MSGRDSLCDWDRSPSVTRRAPLIFRRESLWVDGGPLNLRPNFGPHVHSDYISTRVKFYYRRGPNIVFFSKETVGVQSSSVASSTDPPLFQRQSLCFWKIFSVRQDFLWFLYDLPLIPCNWTDLQRLSLIFRGSVWFSEAQSDFQRLSLIFRGSVWFSEGPRPRYPLSNFFLVPRQFHREDSRIQYTPD